MEQIKWKTIAELTDETVLGTGGLSDKAPRRTARAIVENPDGLYAVMYSKKFNLYTLPGGGMEAGETALEALEREILEETGCTCDTAEPLGIVSENRFHADYTSLCYFFVVHTKTEKGELHLTALEEENGTVAEWHTLDDAVHLIRDRVHDTNQRKFLQARDVAALAAYCETL